MTGLKSQFMFAEETTWGTSVAPTETVPIISESLSAEIERIDSDAIYAGRRVLTSGGWATGRNTISGDVAMELYNTGATLGLLEAMMGNVSTSGAVHTLTPGPLKHYTMQAGRPLRGGSVQPFTYNGCMVTGWEIGASEGEIVTLGIDVAGRQELTTLGQALGTPSLPATLKPFVFHQVTLSLGGSSVCATQMTLSGDNNLKTDKFCLGDEFADPFTEGGLRNYGGALQTSFESLDHYNYYKNAAEVALVATFSNGTESIQINENVRLEGETPTVGGREELEMSVPFMAIASGGGDGSAITITYNDGTV